MRARGGGADAARPPLGAAARRAWRRAAAGGRRSAGRPAPARAAQPAHPARNARAGGLHVPRTGAPRDPACRLGGGARARRCRRRHVPTLQPRGRAGAPARAGSGGRPTGRPARLHPAAPGGARGGCPAASSPFVSTQRSDRTDRHVEKSANMTQVVEGSG